MITRGNDLKIGIPVGPVQDTGQPIKPVILTAHQRARQTLMVGSTGSGKSKAIEHCIRQDILNWPKTGCGLMLIDPHGSVFDSVMGWIAANDLHRWPIIPIDLRRKDQVIAYNLLRQRADGSDPAVAVANFARAIAHAWGAGDLNETPRLGKWLRTLLATLLEHQCTLAEALPLMSKPHLRQLMASAVKDVFARTVWEAARQLRDGEYQEEISSTMNRLMKFLSTQAIRASLCQTGPTLDMGQALEQGSIILVSLATAGGNIDKEDADTLGAVMLSDLWTAATARGKDNEGARRIRPFYVYLDEFQKFVTPAIAEGLDEARGFGLHMLLAQQFPSQLLCRGELGRMIWHSVMTNCRSKIVFNLEHPQDLPELALWLYRQEVDLNQIKFQGYSTKVLGYQVSYLPSYQHSSTSSTGGGESHGSTSGIAIGRGRAHSLGHTSSAGRGSGTGFTDGTSKMIIDDTWVYQETALGSLSHSDSGSDSDFTGESESESWSEIETAVRSEAKSQSSTTNWTSGASLGQSYAPMLIPQLGKEALPPMYRSVEEQLFAFTQELAGLRDRHCVVRLANCSVPIRMMTCTLKQRYTTKAWAEHWMRKTLARIEFVLPVPEALRRIEERLLEFPNRFLSATDAGEPRFTKRRVADTYRIFTPPKAAG